MAMLREYRLRATAEGLDHSANCGPARKLSRRLVTEVESQDEEDTALQILFSIVFSFSQQWEKWGSQTTCTNQITLWPFLHNALTVKNSLNLSTGDCLLTITNWLVTSSLPSSEHIFTSRESFQNHERWSIRFGYISSLLSSQMCCLTGL